MAELAPPSVIETVQPITALGAVAGTVQYMAPEQLAGRPADARSDIYALGAVIYEMATGRAAFGATLAPVVAAPLDRLIRTCLAADPDERWQSAHDVQLQLSAIADASAETAAVSGPPARGRLLTLLPWGVAALTAMVALVSVFRPRPAPTTASSSVIRFSVPPPPGGFFWDNFENVPLALSPDGLQLAFVATDASGVQRIWLRTLSSIDARPVAETDGALSVIWSPDSRSIAFFAGGKLKRLDLPAGAAVTLCDFRGSGMSGTWGRNDQILFAAVGGEAIFQVSASGGTPGRSAEAERRARRAPDRISLVSARRPPVPVSPPACWMARG